MVFSIQEMTKIVLALNGDIRFHGISEDDEKSEENIEKLGCLIDCLIDQLVEVHNTVSGRQELSAEQIDKKIDDVFEVIKFWIKMHDKEVEERLEND